MEGFNIVVILKARSIGEIIRREFKIKLMNSNIWSKFTAFLYQHEIQKLKDIMQFKQFSSHPCFQHLTPFLRGN